MNRATPLKRLLVLLPANEFRELATAAERETRSPEQQVIHLVRQALRADVAPTEGRAVDVQHAS
jgi:hypothetical protein